LSYEGEDIGEMESSVVSGDRGVFLLERRYQRWDA
jgi:hypothetical protein